MIFTDQQMGHQEAEQKLINTNDSDYHPCLSKFMSCLVTKPQQSEIHVESASDLSSALTDILERSVMDDSALDASSLKATMDLFLHTKDGNVNAWTLFHCLTRWKSRVSVGFKL